jgi:metal-responsive CopG/Arc/MetJ family transcriptional regulator
MHDGRKQKVCVSLPADLVAQIDDQARQRARGSRSAMMELWLRRGARAQAEADLRGQVIAYYSSLDADERAEEQALSHAVSRAARRLDIDGRPSRRSRKRQP